jgi:hypothetical protein
VGNFSAQPLSNGEVKAGMDSSENPAQGRLFCSSRESLDPLRFVSNMNFSACSFVSKKRRQSFPFSDNLAGTHTR